MSASVPAVTSNPLTLLWQDVRDERACDKRVPAGGEDASASRARAASSTTRWACCSRATSASGPVFTLKIFHHNAVFMLGPEANHYMLVSHAKNFLWRAGHLRDLIPLLGDGLLTIDGAFHRTHRKLMLPAFHRERIQAATDVMQEEIDRGARGAATGRGRRHLRLDRGAGAAGRDARAVRRRPRPRDAPAA